MTKLIKKINWDDCVLGDMVTLQRGYDLPDRDRVEGLYPIVSSSGITGSHVVPKVEGPGVVTGRYGTLGKVFYIEHDFWPLNTTLYVKEFKGNDPIFIKYLLETLNLKESGGAAAVPGVNRNVLHELPCKKPDILTQKEIVSILSIYDDLIENNLNRIKILEEVAQKIYTEWFVNFRFPGCEKAKFSKDDLPEGWKLESFLEAIKKIVLGGTPSRENPALWGGSIPWIKSGKLNEIRVIDGTEFITREGLDISATKMMPKRTVLIAITGAILISLSEIELCANQSVIGLYNSEKLCQEYIYLYIKNNIQELISKMSGSAQQHINKDIIEKSQIIIPDRLIMKNFEQNIKPVFDLISNMLFYNKNLTNSRNLLVPQLITGKREVK